MLCRLFRTDFATRPADGLAPQIVRPRGRLTHLTGQYIPALE